MKALFITSPGKTEIREIDKPVPSEGEVLLRVRMVGYCGSDLNSFRGRNPMVSFPRIPGHEIAATVEEVTAGAGEGLRPGMDVTLSPYTSCGQCASCRRGRPNACRLNQTMGVQRDGALTEYIAVPWQKVYSSSRLTRRELALVEPLTVGFHAADRGRVGKKDTVAVFGCGAIGLGAIAGAAARGATVVAVDIDDGKLEIARKAGASHVINSAVQSVHGGLLDVAERGPDVVIEAVGVPATFTSAVTEVAFAGRVVYIGYAKEPVAYDTRLFVQKELDILGSRNALGDFADVIKTLEKGSFPVDDMITRVVSLPEAGDALRAWQTDPPAFTKILVDLDAVE